MNRNENVKRLLIAMLAISISFIQMGCRKGEPLNPEKNEVILKESQLPLYVKSKIHELGHDNIWSENYFTNLDSNLVEATDILLETGPWSNGHLFTIGDQKFHMKWNGNRECPPFILFDRKLYYSIARYGKEKNDFKEFGMIDLGKRLKYEYYNSE